MGLDDSRIASLIGNWFPGDALEWVLHTKILIMDQPGLALLALVAEKQIKRGAHKPVKQLTEAIDAFIGQHNKNPNTLRWTKSRTIFWRLPAHARRSRSNWIGTSESGREPALPPRGGE